MNSLPHLRPGVAAITRRDLLWLTTAVLPGMSMAQEYPAKTARLMVGTVPGGSLDFGARIIAQPLAEALSTTVIVENRPGNGGATNVALVAKSRPDGATLLYTTATGALLIPQAMVKPPVNALTDLIAVNMLGYSPVALGVNPRLGIKTLKELIVLSRTRPISLASTGTGSLMHLMIETMAQATGAKILHVPYKGTGPGIVDTMAGHIDGVFSDLAPQVPYLEDGRLIIIAVSTEKRLEAYPNIPAMAEDMPGFSVMNWQGVFVPAKTPVALVERLNAALLKVAAREDVRALFHKGGIEVAPMATTERFQKLVEADYLRWGKLLHEKGITAE